MEKWLVVNSLFHSLTRCFEIYDPLKLVVLKVFWGGLNRARVGEKLFFSKTFHRCYSTIENWVRGGWYGCAVWQEQLQGLELLDSLEEYSQVKLTRTAQLSLVHIQSLQQNCRST